jgi:hypothetical protein
METAGHNSKFADRVLRLLERVEYRRAETQEEKAAIYRMRHDAYTRAGSVEPRPARMFHDPYDETPNAWLIGLFIDGDLASSLRLHVSASMTAPLPALPAYPDILGPHLRAGRMIIDPSRFVGKLEYLQRYSELPYLTLRPTFLAEEFFGADYVTAACRVEHQAFFRRMFGAVSWASAREYPDFNKPMVFLGYECRAQRESIHARYPFYRSSDLERVRLFERSSNLTDGVLRAIGREAESELTSA